MEMLKKRIIRLLWGLMFILVVCWGVNFANIPAFHVEGNTIARNLGWMILPMDSEPIGRNVAWDSELPKFVQEDMEYAEERGYDIEYEFKGNIIHIEKIEDEWTLNVKTRMDFGSTWDGLTNFSMYQTSGHEIIVYGYTFMGEWFQKITLQKNEAEINTITYDVNLPLSEFYRGDSIGSMRVGGYSLMRENQTFTFYKDGWMISSQDFTHGVITDMSIYKGIIITETNSLYMMYVELMDGIPTLRFIYGGEADGIVTTISYSSRLQEVGKKSQYIGMVEKDGQNYAIVPADWKTFDKFSLARENNEEIYKATAPFDFGVNLVKLGEENLKEVSFRYLSNDWYATIVFDLNGREFYSEYRFGGYDRETILPEEVSAPFDGKTVYSFEEMWETIDTIRKIYFDYYEHRGDFVPPVLLL